MLVLHIGLPKTGTTFLQHHIFQRSEQIDFVHRKYDLSEHELANNLKKYARASTRRAPTLRAEIIKWFQEHDAKSREEVSRPLLVSEENISVDATGFWTGRGAVPGRLATRLARLRANLPPALRTVKVIIGIRSQDQWLASRYAESSRIFPEFGQEDFDTRMLAISQSQTLENTYAWLDYAAVHQTFSQALGKGNVFIAPMEQMFATPRPFFDALGSFIGDSSLPRLYDDAVSRNPRPQNRLSKGENRWTLRSNGQEIVLTEGLREALLSRFATSNATLSQTLAITAAAD